MVCLGYFLTVSCEKNVDFFKKNNQHFFKKYIFDWPESGIRILLVIFGKRNIGFSLYPVALDPGFAKKSKGGPFGFT